MSEGGSEEPGGAVGLPDRPCFIDQLPPALQESYWDFQDTSYDRYWDFAWEGLGCSHADADEAVDAAFAEIGKEWLRMQSMENPAGFAWRILKFRIEDVRRKRKKRPEPMDLTVLEASADETAEDPYHQLTQRIVVHQAMRHLTERQRDVLTMTTRLQYTDQEIALIMGVTPNTVRTTRSQAMQKLKRLLASETDHPDGGTS
ncbi:sigma-70 family RNA polymerase sigma factor [Streptomyces sp. ISL-44]|uniref:sigma-70 family RNA polymerase sigma factor n=1 Tax=Streptomyces sp. ISL-44 TaxID=2819184 RepID=UPI001BE9E721|nr:sigma-70 family RNA polymerase sigma factor [Streptomyces sp. ISL-44]MBT2539765.1 sigma-70 family RNA polymerase sigma factor [Streptomyces sp. ISL-44]